MLDDITKALVRRDPDARQLSGCARICGVLRFSSSNRGQPSGPSTARITSAVVICCAGLAKRYPPSAALSAHNADGAKLGEDVLKRVEGDRLGGSDPLGGDGFLAGDGRSILPTTASDTIVLRSRQSSSRPATRCPSRASAPLADECFRDLRHSDLTESHGDVALDRMRPGGCRSGLAPSPGPRRRRRTIRAIQRASESRPRSPLGVSVV